MGSSTKDNFLENPYVKFTYKAVAAAFIIGGSWVKLETNIDKMSDRIVKKLDEHILSDGFEKKAMMDEISELKNWKKDIQDDIKEYLKSEFTRPDEAKIHEERVR